MRLLTSILATTVLLGSAVAAHGSDEWKTILSIQLNKEKGCYVHRFSGTQVYELLGKTNIRTEAHCVDGRVYTATRSGPIEKVHLSICPTKC